MCSVVCSNAARLATSARPIAVYAGIRHPYASTTDECSTEHSADQRGEAFIAPCAEVPVEAANHKRVFGTGYGSALVFWIRVGAAEEVGGIISRTGDQAAYTYSLCDRLWMARKSFGRFWADNKTYWLHIDKTCCKYTINSSNQSAFTPKSCQPLVWGQYSRWIRTKRRITV